MAKQQKDKVDAPDIQIEDKEPYTTPDLKVTWETSADGVTTVRISGHHEVTITERAGVDGPVYESKSFRSKPTGIKEAINAAVKNSATAAFLSEWRERNPTQRKTIDSLMSENERLQKQIEDMRRMLLEQYGDGVESAA